MRITTGLEVVKENLLKKGMGVGYVQNAIDYILYLEKHQNNDNKCYFNEISIPLILELVERLKDKLNKVRLLITNVLNSDEYYFEHMGDVDRFLLEIQQILKEKDDDYGSIY